MLAACDNSAASDGPTARGASPTASAPERAPTNTAEPERDAEAAVVAAYLDFWDAVEAAGNPPDPDHPALAETAAGHQLDQLRESLEEYREKGYFRNDDGEHDVTFRRFLEGGEAAVVDDCAEPAEDSGLYDAATGERVGEAGRPGQRQLLEARLELVGGAWKVVNVNLVEGDSTCVPATG